MTDTGFRSYRVYTVFMRTKDGLIPIWAGYQFEDFPPNPPEQIRELETSRVYGPWVHPNQNHHLTPAAKSPLSLDQFRSSNDASS